MNVCVDDLEKFIKRFNGGTLNVLVHYVDDKGDIVRWNPTTPSPQDWKKELERVFPCIQSNCDNNGTLTVGNEETGPEPEQCEYCFKVRFPVISFISDLLVEEKRKAQDEILAPLNMVCVGDNWLSIQAYKDLLASLTHNI